MKRTASTLLLAIFFPVKLFAGTYIPQSAFSLPISSIAGMDRDSLGNLYVLGVPANGATYQVSSYATQGISPIFSFDTGLSSMANFAVENSGIVDILSTSNGFTLKRFENTGAFVGQASFSLGYVIPNLFSTTIDKFNDFVYIAYQYTYSPIYVECLGCQGPSSVTVAKVNQYDFQGNLLRTFPMAGTTSCDTPSVMTVDPQGDLYVADNMCREVLKFSSSGSFVSATPASWSSIFNPVGMWTDPASNLYISETICGAMGCPAGIAKLGTDGTFQTSFITNSAVGCAWDQRILYLSSSGYSPLQRFIYSDPPSVATESNPIGMVVQHSSEATMSWQAANDPNGDPVAYTIYLGTSPENLAASGSTPQTGFTTQPLAFGATYYWQLVAQNSYLGLPLQQTPAPIINFNINLINAPPGNFYVSSGTGTFVTRASSQTLSWTEAVDPDSDAVFYALNISTIAGFFTTALASTATYYDLNFTFGTTYYWLVSAFDNFGASSTISGSTQTFLPIFLNQAPTSPNIISPFVQSPVVKTMGNDVSVSWNQVSDPQNDPITYTLYFGQSPTDMSALAVISQASQNLPSPGSGQAAPLDLRPLSATPETQALGAAAQISVSQDTSSIAVNLTSLAYYQNYYLQVAAANPYGATTMTQIQTFSLASSAGFPKAYNYPNPFSPNRGGTHIVFNAPPSGYSQATVEIYSEWQALLFKHDYFNIPPGISQVTFDGHDRYGRSLFNGSYICRVRFSGPGDGTTFYMLVVK